VLFSAGLVFTQQFGWSVRPLIL